MRVIAIILLIGLSACAPGDAPRRAEGDAAQALRPDRPARGGADAAGAARIAAFRRDPAESADSFALRAGPGGELVHPVITTDVWSPGDTALIAYYRQAANVPAPDSSASPIFESIGYAFLPDAAHGYRRVEIGLIEHDGAEPEIQSVFFANADTMPGPELVVMATWRIYNYFVGGVIYGTHVYALRPGADGRRFVYLEDVSEKVSGTCDCDRRDEPDEMSRFKTAAEVRAGLRALGYR
jgi:hypothetical protein